MSDYIMWWQLPTLALFLLVWVLGGSALLFVGWRFILHDPNAKFSSSISTWLLASLAGGALSLIPFVGWIPGLLVSWWVISKRFKTTFGRAILAWLPTLGQGVVTVPLLVAILVPSLGLARENARSVGCSANLHSIGVGVMMYAAESNDYMPANFDLLTRYGSKEQMFRCPSDPNKQNGSYFFFCPKDSAGNPKRLAELDHRCFIACDLKENHIKQSRNVLQADGVVVHLKHDDFLAELAQPHNADFAEAFHKAQGE